MTPAGHGSLAWRLAADDICRVVSVTSSVVTTVCAEREREREREVSSETTSCWRVSVSLPLLRTSCCVTLRYFNAVCLFCLDPSTPTRRRDVLPPRSCVYCINAYYDTRVPLWWVWRHRHFALSLSVGQLTTPGSSFSTQICLTLLSVSHFCPLCNVV